MRFGSLISLLAIAGVPTLAMAQSIHGHDGFYLSSSLSLASGDINQSASNGPFSSATYSGAGLQFDLRVGGAVSRNNILSFDLSTRAIASPSVDMDGGSYSTNSNASVGDTIIGIGFTHYFMPANAFVGVTVGTGSFTYNSGYNNSNSNGSSQQGFGYILRAGREWRVARRVGMGVVGGVAHLSASDQSIPGYPDYSSTLTTTRVFLGFTTTFN